MLYSGKKKKLGLVRSDDKKTRKKYLVRPRVVRVVRRRGAVTKIYVPNTVYGRVRLDAFGVVIQ